MDNSGNVSPFLIRVPINTNRNTITSSLGTGHRDIDISNILLPKILVSPWK